MKKAKKQGFTIVELVIVIAVIAILAAVLIPTFSNIINKSNLSADKQAVREMNMALAEWEASTGYAVPADVETVMRVLANAGYNTDNWVCLADGYQVYWYQNDNRMILYNARTAQIEYPDEYVGTKTMVSAENNFFVYNENHVKAQQFDMGLSSQINPGTAISAGSSLSSNQSLTQSSGINSAESSNIGKINSAVTNSAVSNALLSSSANKGNGNTLYYYATREIVSAETGNAFASLQVSAVGTEADANKLVSNGKLQENLYYISIVNNGGSETEVKAAQKAAGQYVYNIFSQMTTGKVTEEAVIILEGGTVIDCSSCEWAPCRTFSGYFGTDDPSNPIIIDGARLTPATGHNATVAFNGSGSKYFVTGFFGTIYGDTTIENVTFRNIKIESPATDYELTESDRGAKLINTRNTVGIIGGITDNYTESNPTGTPANVTLKNIVVDATCEITGAGCAGGLVGYIGSSKSSGLALQGNITIDNCQVHADVTSTDNHSAAGYKSVGGIIGFSCRVNNSTVIKVKDCVVDSKLTGYGNTGAVAGAFQNYPTVIIDGGTYDAATLRGDNVTASVVGYIDNTNTPITLVHNPALKDGLAHTYKSSSSATPLVIHESGYPTAE